ncbi:TRAP transporter small permease [Thioalkalivibrio sp. HK1]|uniref:TRAP transporter small permease n=1 Tax=Thioalkalivibrio sp. HK1 TaxID=1469245 RepID=UPI0004B4F467|nr:TRAP transporter small permease [Thioalkalivibrio sp. HK1]
MPIIEASSKASRILDALRPGLDTLYRLCGLIAAAFLLLLLLIIVAQMVARWSGHVFVGATGYAGYCMAGSVFFALAHTLDRKAHIRVNLLLLRLASGPRRWLQAWCFGIGSVIAIHFAVYAIRATWWSWKLNDISQGQDAWPLWIPQLSMAFGTVVFSIALVDRFLSIVFAGQSGEDDDEPSPQDESRDR